MLLVWLFFPEVKAVEPKKLYGTDNIISLSQKLSTEADRNRSSFQTTKIAKGEREKQNVHCCVQNIIFISWKVEVSSAAVIIF